MALGALCRKGQNAPIHLGLRPAQRIIVKRGCNDSLLNKHKKREELRSLHQFGYDRQNSQHPNLKV